MNIPLRLRFLSKIDRVESGCWEWRASRGRGGYGQLREAGGGSRMISAHRVAYELFTGPIPDGLEIDHLCRNRGCVNPEHLEAVTPLENMRRGKLAKTACKHGHPYTEENTVLDRHGHRSCRTCRQASQRAYDARRRPAA